MTLAGSSGVVSAALMIAGVSVGAGILGVPVVAGLAGSLPALAAVFFSWVLMLITGWVLALGLVRRRRPDQDIQSLYRAELGPQWTRFAAAIYLFLFYCLLSAFLGGGGEVLSRLSGRPQDQAWFTLGFFAVTTAVVLYGPQLVQKCNALLMFLLAASFIFLLSQCAVHFETERLSYQNWAFLPNALPILFCAFGYHNIIPLTCRSLDFDWKRIRLALILGTGLVFVFNISWIMAVIGALPLEGAGQGNLAAAFRQNQPATIPLSQALDSSWTLIGGGIFSLLAITTSHVGASLALTGFLRDLFAGLKRPPGRLLTAALALLPPCVVALAYPRLFLSALNAAGGFGLILLFGLLPSLILCRWGGRARTAGLLLAAVFVALLLLESAQEAGVLRISPDWEHWLVHLPRPGR